MIFKKIGDFFKDRRERKIKEVCNNFLSKIKDLNKSLDYLVYIGSYSNWGNQQYVKSVLLKTQQEIFKMKEESIKLEKKSLTEHEQSFLKNLKNNIGELQENLQRFK